MIMMMVTEICAAFLCFQSMLRIYLPANIIPILHMGRLRKRKLRRLYKLWIWYCISWLFVLLLSYLLH